MESTRRSTRAIKKPEFYTDSSLVESTIEDNVDEAEPELPESEESEDELEDEQFQDLEDINASLRQKKSSTRKSKSKQAVKKNRAFAKKSFDDQSIFGQLNACSL